MNKTTELMIVLTTGKQDRGTRATLALSWGCAALAMGQEVSLFLTMDGSVWAVNGSAQGVVVAGFEPLEEYFKQFIELGGELLVCAPCSEYYCSVESMGDKSRLRKNAQLSGLATIVSKIGEKTKTVSF
jgi:predicted peroxiredoxin